MAPPKPPLGALSKSAWSGSIKFSYGSQNGKEPDHADLDNAPSGGFGGAITAALFLRRFVSKPNSYIHFDIYSWSDTNKPGLPKGGITQGPRAIFNALPKILEI